MTDVTAPLPTAVDRDDVTARLRLGVTRLNRRLRQQSDSGLSPSQLSALAVINREGPLTLGDLAELEHVAPPSITKVVDKLEALLLVERRPDPTDRRVRHVTTTAAGRDLLVETRARKDAWLAQRLAALDGDDLARIDAALPVLERLVAPDPSPLEGPA